MKMKSFSSFMLVLMFCHLWRAQEHSSYNDRSLLAPYGENDGDTGETQMSRTEEGENNTVSQSDLIWDEMRDLRNMVAEQGTELRYLTTRITAAEGLVDALQRENIAMEARMTAAEALAEELQMKSDAQTLQLAVAEQNLYTIQERMTVSECLMDNLEKQQEGQNVTVQELLNTSEVRKVAFSASLLQAGEGNTGHSGYHPLAFRNVFTNIGNHYSPITGYFTAPVRGVYYFRFTGHVADTVGSMLLRLAKNGQTMVFAGDRHATSADAEDSASNGVVLQLQVGDVVCVEMNGHVWDDQYHRTTFSGFLLFPL